MKIVDLRTAPLSKALLSKEALATDCIAMAAERGTSGILEGGLPGVYWDPKSKTVAVSMGDWNSKEECQKLREALLKVPGVKDVEMDAEWSPPADKYQPVKYGKYNTRISKAKDTKVPPCPHCSSTDTGLMPPDFETAKCGKCGRCFRGNGKPFQTVKVSKALFDHIGAHMGFAPHTPTDFGRPMPAVSAPMIQRGPSAPPAAVQSHKAFTNEEMNLPSKVPQAHGNLDKLRTEASTHKEHLDKMIDKGVGVGQKLGYHIVDGRSPTREDFEEAHKKGGMVVTAPLKGSNDGGKRMHDKIRDDYGGDASHLKDISRATIAVSHPADIPHLMGHLREHGMKLAQQPKNGFEHPTPAGYSDVNVAPRLHGHIGELQVHALDMFEAKNHGIHGHAPGHQMYDEIRDEKTAPDRKAHLEAKSRELYGEAHKRMMERTPKLATLSKAKYIQKRTPLPSAKMKSVQVRDLNAVGHFEFEGLPVKRSKPGGLPHLFNGVSYRPLLSRELGKFHHEAWPISKKEFDDMCAERSQIAKKHKP